ncbi:hypothetical protein LTR02_010987 [Friedmanniomyces endolithicus]|nr:hypothetical protein LTR02_010987 [Friedmanniomyces endolithicus]
MHWYAIKRSTRSHESYRSFSRAESLHAQDQHHSGEGPITSRDHTPNTPLGHDDAADARSRMMEATSLHVVVLGPKTGNNEETRLEDVEEYLQISMPISSSGVTTFAYQMALQNRTKNDKLQPHGVYDTRSYKPTFIHDCLMLPGSLANLLGKIESVELINRMTPALLPGFHAHVHADTLQPCILQSTDARNCVQGMVVFGLGATSREIIHNHYRANGRRVKVEVEIDVWVAISQMIRDPELERYQLERRKVWAHTWLWADAGSGDSLSHSQTRTWNIDDYLDGNFELRQTPHVAEEWSDVDLDVFENSGRPDKRVEERECIHASAGHLDYMRGPGFTGW